MSGERFHYRFNWDAQKARLNLSKHGVDFKRASSVFEDPRAISISDETHGADEDRWVTIGIDATGTVVVVSHLFDVVSDQAASVRIISARKATRNEVKWYIGENL